MMFAFRREFCGELRFMARAVRIAVLVAMLLVCAVSMARANSVTPTTTWMNIYSDDSTFAGVPIPAGAYVAVFDQQGIQCGEFDMTRAGYYGFMPCYGDDPSTPADEGATQGDRLSFTINGAPCTAGVVSRNFVAQPPDAIVTWIHQDLWKINLIVPPRPPVTTTLQSGQLRLDWQPVGAEVVRYEIWRSTVPHFTPGDAGAEQPGAVIPGAGSLGWSAVAGVGDPGVNYAYRVQSLNERTQTVGISQAVAEFDFALYR